MKIALLCPSNMLYMPYVENYKKILDQFGTDYDIINWDRFKIEEESEWVYRDNKVGHQRNFFDYYYYSKHVIKTIKRNRYDKVIVFGMQLSFFLKSFLKKEYDNKYVFDIRDYNKIIHFFNVRSLINSSCFTTISSHGFMEWLPNNCNYVVNHNTWIEKIDCMDIEDVLKTHSSQIRISYIGSIRDFDMNSKFISVIANNKSIELIFNGDGIAYNQLVKYVDENSISNIKFTGRYNREDENQFYTNSDLINILVPNNDINSRTLLPNRLYNSIINGKPVLAFKGTFVANIVEKHHLGIVIDDFSNVEKVINDYFRSFDAKQFKNYCINFMATVISDNRVFKNEIIHFISTEDEKNEKHYKKN